MENAARKILTALDREKIARLCGVKPRSIRTAMKNGIPSSWFPIIRQLCEEAEIDCPEAAFNWKQPVEDAGEAA